MLETEPQIVDQYIRPGTVRLVYRHLLQLGERSELLAEAAECAADQDRFWELRRAIYARYNQLYSDTLAGVEAAASDIGADPQALRACLDAATHEAAVRADDAAASAEGSDPGPSLSSVSDGLSVHSPSLPSRSFSTAPSARNGAMADPSGRCPSPCLCHDAASRFRSA